ncbi:MAG: molecular chaperone DnaJ [Desulfobacterales bacterium CG23_combo_of_CG06-09_8_20_14_all_51_8]|nr:MAG: molecular chaperone DnaJ [Desulfobacterales bacterium CG23_combo_of_CG06-09_8_20_14_all_51_8]
MSSKRDYYEVLGVSRDVDAGELKSRYRKVALKYHPDRNPGDPKSEELFKEASEAYSVLSDPQKRQIYDQFGHRGLEGMGRGSAGGFEDVFSSFGDIFEDFFGFRTGGRGGRSSARRGSDLRYDLTIDFLEAAFGKEMEIEIEKYETCPTCEGSGARPGTYPETCAQCRGTGQFVRTQGFFSVKSTCPGCRGAGQVIKEHCPQCKGRQRIIVTKRVSIKIPAGVDSGSKLRLTGEGESGVQGGPPGDLYVFINVKPHEFFKRSNADVISTVELTFVQAALGDEITVPTLTGEETLKIPKGTQYADTFRLPGQGIPSLRSGVRGDQIVQVDLKTPKNMSRKQEDLLREFSRLESDKLSKKFKRFFKGGSTQAAK